MVLNMRPNFKLKRQPSPILATPSKLSSHRPLSHIPPIHASSNIMTIQIIVHELACIIPRQLRILHHLIKEQALHVPGMERNALASRICAAAVLHAAQQSRVGLLVDGFVVETLHDSVAGDGA